MRENKADRPRIIYKADMLLWGWMAIIGLAEASHICAIVFGWTFSACEDLFLGAFAMFFAMIALGLIFGWHMLAKDAVWKKVRARQRVRRKLEGRGIGVIDQLVRFGFAVIVVLQIILLIMESRNYMVGDATVETVNTMLSTDTIYQINPFTGLSYEAGIPMRLRILCLPSLYAFASDALHIPAWRIVWCIAPIITLLLGYTAFDLVGRELFSNSNRRLFLLFVAILFLFGNYQSGLDDFGVQFAGGRGETIRAVILIPYVISAILRRKWYIVGLCIITECCIVWTFYGLGACLLVAVFMLLIQNVPKMLTKIGRRDVTLSGPEGDKT